MSAPPPPLAPAGVGARMLAVIVLTGLGAGLGGAALTLLLHLVQHLAFGYTEDTFLTGVEHASPARRVSVMGMGGLLVGRGVASGFSCAGGEGESDGCPGEGEHA